MSFRFALLFASCRFLLAQPDIAHLSQTVKENPTNEQARVELAAALADSNRRDEAITQFEEALRLKPNDPDAHSGLGIVLLETGDVAGATQHLDRALQLYRHTPDAAYTMYVRARIYSRQNDTKKAAALLTSAVTLRPDLAEAWSDLGLARKALLDDKGALQAFRRAAELNPSDAVAQYRLGDEYLHQNQPRLAAECLEKAYRLNPQDQSTLNALQMALRREGKVQEANQIKQKLAELLVARDRANQNAVAAIKLNNEGASLEKAGNLPAAVEKYREALNLYPEHVGIRVNYAIALLRTGQWTEGLNQLHEAGLRDPGNAKIQAALKDALSQAPPNLIPHWASNR
jgi:tetratricopeptide (TPR) repeat protein